MCGIAGRKGAAWFNVPDAIGAIAHRGPDGSGFVEHCGVSHGHCRLAIQDTTAGSAQPFRYRDGVLSYNGELWEADLLRSILSDEGCSFATTGDTEVLAAAVHSWGLDVFPRLDGAFAFAWSSPGLKFLARSRFGSVPLYYLRDKTGVSWASERKAWGRLAALAEPLPPAHYLDLSDPHARPVRYYEIPRLRFPPADSFQVEPLLVEGVKKRLAASDVPVCSLLSGGLDSSLVAAIAARVRPDLVCFVAYTDPASEDLAAARVAARHIGVRLEEVYVPPPTAADLTAAVWTVEVPNPTAVEITTIAKPLAAAVRAAGFKVALTGEGADELFGGYGPMARRLGEGKDWRDVRLAALEKMGRADFHRVNKSFMWAGVEPRVPFMERRLVEGVLSLSVKECPPGKSLLRAVGRRYLPPAVWGRQKKSFHIPSGTQAACRAAVAHPVRFYNAELRRLFGGVVRG